MPKGLITSLLLKLTVDFWYLSLLALLIKLLLIRYTATNSIAKVYMLWILGSITFFCVACLAGIIFSSSGYYYIPIIMYLLSTLAELAFSSTLFKISSKRLILSVVIGNGLFFLLLFMQML